MILRNQNPRSVKHIMRQPLLLPIPEDESCRDWICETKCDLSQHDSFYLINEARRNRGLAEFSRSTQLDDLARLHVMQMSAVRAVFHSVSCVGDLKAKLVSEEVGENVQRGDSALIMHLETLRASRSINRSNVLNVEFDSFGSATVVGDDRKVYCCHLFRKR